METLMEILSPGFLLRNSVYVSLLVGAVCPLVGVYLVLRRLVFMGVALPQISSAGIAFALSMHVWFGHGAESHGEEQRLLALIGSTGFTLAAILWLSLMEKRGRGSVEGRLGTAYVVAMAASILLLAKCPVAERGWLNLLKGEIIAISNADLAVTAVTVGLVLVALKLFNKEFLLVSFDREMAITLKRNVVLWDLGLFLLIGFTIAIAVLSVGPLIAFGFLLIPPLIVRQFAATMRQLSIGSSIIGGVAALAGFAVAYEFDLPVGPTDVALLGGLYALAYLGRTALDFWSGRRMAPPE